LVETAESASGTDAGSPSRPIRRWNDAAKVQLSLRALTSPIDGVAEIRQIDVGQYHQPFKHQCPSSVTPESITISLISRFIDGLRRKSAGSQQKHQGPARVLRLQPRRYDPAWNQACWPRQQRDPADQTGSIQLKASFGQTSRRLWPANIVNSAACSSIQA